jgi:hypothetical protein
LPGEAEPLTAADQFAERVQVAVVACREADAF